MRKLSDHSLKSMATDFEKANSRHLTSSFPTYNLVTEDEHSRAVKHIKDNCADHFVFMFADKTNKNVQYWDVWPSRPDTAPAEKCERLKQLLPPSIQVLLGRNMLAPAGSSSKKRVGSTSFARMPACETLSGAKTPRDNHSFVSVFQFLQDATLSKPTEYLTDAEPNKQPTLKAKHCLMHEIAEAVGEHKMDRVGGTSKTCKAPQVKASEGVASRKKSRVEAEAEAASSLEHALRDAIASKFNAFEFEYTLAELIDELEASFPMDKDSQILTFLSTERSRIDFINVPSLERAKRGLMNFLDSERTIYWDFTRDEADRNALISTLEAAFGSSSSSSKDFTVTFPSDAFELDEDADMKENVDPLQMVVFDDFLRKDSVKKQGISWNRLKHETKCALRCVLEHLFGVSDVDALENLRLDDGFDCLALHRSFQSVPAHALRAPSVEHYLNAIITLETQLTGALNMLQSWEGSGHVKDTLQNEIDESEGHYYAVWCNATVTPVQLEVLRLAHANKSRIECLEKLFEDSGSCIVQADGLQKLTAEWRAEKLTFRHNFFESKRHPFQVVDGFGCLQNVCKGTPKMQAAANYGKYMRDLTPTKMVAVALHTLALSITGTSMFDEHPADHVLSQMKSDNVDWAGLATILFANVEGVQGGDDVIEYLRGVREKLAYCFNAVLYFCLSQDGTKAAIWFHRTPNPAECFVQMVSKSLHLDAEDMDWNNVELYAPDYVWEAYEAHLGHRQDRLHLSDNTGAQFLLSRFQASMAAHAKDFKYAEDFMYNNFKFPFWSSRCVMATPSAMFLSRNASKTSRQELDERHKLYLLNEITRHDITQSLRSITDPIHCKVVTSFDWENQHYTINILNAAVVKTVGAKEKKPRAAFELCTSDQVITNATSLASAVEEAYKTCVNANSHCQLIFVSMYDRQLGGAAKEAECESVLHALPFLKVAVSGDTRDTYEIMMFKLYDSTRRATFEEQMEVKKRGAAALRGKPAGGAGALFVVHDDAVAEQ